ncbi:type I restriction endonuclease [Methanococcoides sp. AM1]|uniref:type I restriction endonuclease n=1 Tax=Methanococcoides sp. AM1 TaxID=1201011 RepID=UPI001082E3D6|nr:type I restriction endonuclease [Methanococcoides sp. AM1]
MDFIDEIKALAKKIPTHGQSIQTEEATKNALVMPMINILGYNVFDPTEVVPEFTADHGTKKGEKVDYAIFKDDVPIILIECKSIDSDLTPNHASQLFRYFNVTEAKVGILTNGIIYKFFSDLEATNKMDDKPFLEFDLNNIREPLIKELKRFKKEAFDLDELTNVASELKYTKEIKQSLSSELNSPSDDFIKMFATRVYGGRLTPQVREKFSSITKNAFSQFINETINERLQSAMAAENDATKVTDTSDVEHEDEPIPVDDGIVTTEEEMEAFLIVRGILREIVDFKKIVMRDTKSYCGVLFEDNNRKPICRFHFNTKQKYLAVIDSDRNEAKHPISDLNEIYGFADELKTSVGNYLHD